MKRVVIILAILCGSAWAMEASMTAAEHEQCQQEGGCVFATAAAINARIKSAWDAGYKRGQVVCRGGA